MKWPAGSRRTCNTYGYVWVKVQGHESFKDGWVLEHHYTWWKYRKERVGRGFVLHHKDHDKKNNKLKNLKLMTRAEHTKLHNVGVKFSDERKASCSAAALKRCTPEWRKAVSDRVKAQHKAGKFGAATLTEEGKAERSLKLSKVLKGRANPRPRGWACSSESRERYIKAAIKREALKKLNRNN